MNLLDVYFHNKKIGVLKEHNSRLSFKYSDDATEAIAHQLPLQKEAFGDKLLVLLLLEILSAKNRIIF